MARKELKASTGETRECVTRMLRKNVKPKLYEEMAKIWGAHDKYAKNVVYKDKNNETKD